MPPRLTRLLLVVAGIALSTNAATALDCNTFFTATDVQRQCFRFVGLIGETRGGVRVMCSVLQAAYRIQGSQGATSDGKKDLEACRQEFPDPPPPTPQTSTAYMRGVAALDAGDFDEAIAEFTTAVTDDPKDTFSYIRRGTAYEKKGDAASAIGDYRKVLKLVDVETGAEYAAKIRKLESGKIGLKAKK